MSLSAERVIQHIKISEEPLWVILPPHIIRQLPIGLIVDLEKVDGICGLTTDELEKYKNFYGQQEK